jgi:hypothetical protein
MVRWSAGQKLLTIYSRDEEKRFAGHVRQYEAQAPLFDIVNGFFNRCRGDMGLVFMRLAARLSG